MPILNHRQEFILTSTVESFLLPVTDPFEIYEIKSSGTIIIPGTTSFNISGTLIEGHTYIFRYTADTQSGDITIMGTSIPAHLLQKELTINAYYNGSAWEVTITPDFLESGIIENSSLVVSPGIHVDAAANSAGVDTANIAGAQQLASVTIPANTAGPSANMAYRITAIGTGNAVGDKSILIRADVGAQQIILYKGNVQAIQGLFKIDILVSTILPYNYQIDALQIGGDQASTSWEGSGVNWDYSIPQDIKFFAEEIVPAGALVTFKQLRVEKIIS